MINLQNSPNLVVDPKERDAYISTNKSKKAIALHENKVKAYRIPGIVMTIAAVALAIVAATLTALFAPIFATIFVGTATAAAIGIPLLILGDKNEDKKFSHEMNISSNLFSVLNFIDKINDTGVFGRTAAHQACLDGDIETLKILIERGELITASDDNFHTPLDIAVARGHLDIIKLIEKYAAKLELPYSLFEGCCGLKIAYHYQQHNVLKYLVQKAGFTACFRSDSNECIYTKACRGQRIEDLDIMIDSIQEGEEFHGNELWNIIDCVRNKQDRCRLVLKLIDKGYCTKKAITHTEFTSSITNGDTPIVERMLTLPGARLEFNQVRGISRALRANDYAMMQLLINHGIRGLEGTELNTAIQNRAHRYIELLIDNFTLDNFDPIDIAPLIGSYFDQHIIKTIKALLSKGYVPTFEAMKRAINTFEELIDPFLNAGYQFTGQEFSFAISRLNELDDSYINTRKIIAIIKKLLLRENKQFNGQEIDQIQGLSIGPSQIENMCCILIDGGCQLITKHNLINAFEKRHDRLIEKILNVKPKYKNECKVIKRAVGSISFIVLNLAIKFECLSLDGSELNLAIRSGRRNTIDVLLMKFKLTDFNPINIEPIMEDACIIETLLNKGYTPQFKDIKNAVTGDYYPAFHLLLNDQYIFTGEEFALVIPNSHSCPLNIERFNKLLEREDKRFAGNEIELAIEHGSFEAMDAFLNAGVRSFTGREILMLVEKNRYDECEKLLKINSALFRDKATRELAVAARNNNIPLVRLLLEHKFPFSGDELIEALNIKDVDAIDSMTDFLLLNGFKDFQGGELRLALYSNKPKLCKQLLEINPAAFEKGDEIDIAIKNDDLETIKLLRDHKFEFSKDSFYIALENQAKTVINELKRLIHYGALSFEFGFRELDAAAKMGDTDLCKYILQKNPDCDKEAVAISQIEKGVSGALEALLEDDISERVLFAAIRSKNSDVLTVVLGKNFELTPKAFNLACEIGIDLKFINQLYELDEDIIDDATTDAASPLDFAAKRKDFELVTFLLSKGANFLCQIQGQYPLGRFTERELNQITQMEIERHLLRGDLNKVLSALNAQRISVRMEIADQLEAKYPNVPLHIHLVPSLYEIDLAHLEVGFDKELPPPPAGAALDQLETLFDMINFTDKNKPNYRDPDHLKVPRYDPFLDRYVDTKVSLAVFKGYLTKTIKAIKEENPNATALPDGYRGAADRREFYKRISTMLLHLIDHHKNQNKERCERYKTYKEQLADRNNHVAQNEGDYWSKPVDHVADDYWDNTVAFLKEFCQGGVACGTGWIGIVEDHYRRLRGEEAGKDLTLPQQIYCLLAKERRKVVEEIVRNKSRRSVHTLNKYLWFLKSRGVPGSESAHLDHIVFPRTYDHAHIQRECEAEFDAVYTRNPKRIAETVINALNSGKGIEYSVFSTAIKEKTPAEWKSEKYLPIENTIWQQFFNKYPNDDLIDAYLQSKGIARAGQSWEEAIRAHFTNYRFDPQTNQDRRWDLDKGAWFVLPDDGVDPAEAKIKEMKLSLADHILSKDEVLKERLQAHFEGLNIEWNEENSWFGALENHRKESFLREGVYGSNGKIRPQVVVGILCSIGVLTTQ